MNHLFGYLAKLTKFELSQVAFHLSGLHLSRTCSTSSVVSLQSLMLCWEGSVIATSVISVHAFSKSFMWFSHQNGKQRFCLPLSIDLLLILLINFVSNMLSFSMSRTYGIGLIRLSSSSEFISQLVLLKFHL